MDGLKGAFLDGDGSGIEKLFADRFCVVRLKEVDNPLADAFVGGVPELDVELHIPLDVEALIRAPPFAANLPFRLTLEEVKMMGFWLGNDDGEQLPVLGIAGLLDCLIVEKGVQLVLDVLDWHLLRLDADFARATYHSVIMIAKTVIKIKRG